MGCPCSENRQKATVHYQQSIKSQTNYRKSTAKVSRVISTQADCFKEPSCEPTPNYCAPECEGLKSCFHGGWLEPYIGTVFPLSYHFNNENKLWTFGMYPTTEENVVLATVPNPDFNPNQPISVVNPKTKWEYKKLFEGCGEQTLFIKDDFLALSQRNLPSTVSSQVNISPLVLTALENLPDYEAGKQLTTYNNNGYVDMRWEVAGSYTSSRDGNIIELIKNGEDKGLFAKIDITFDKNTGSFYYTDTEGKQNKIDNLDELGQLIIGQQDNTFTDTSTIDFEVDNKDVKAEVKISAETGNIITKKTDGIYAIADQITPATYDNATYAELGGVMIAHDSALYIDANGVLSLDLPSHCDAGFVSLD